MRNDANVKELDGRKWENDERPRGNGVSTLTIYTYANFTSYTNSRNINHGHLYKHQSNTYTYKNICVYSMSKNADPSIYESFQAYFTSPRSDEISFDTFS